jgi:hypothetical protein
MTANSIKELAEQIREAPTPTGAKRIAEFSTLRSFAFAPLFAEVFGCAGFCNLEQGSDPPDYCLITPAAKVSVEVTSITTGKLRIFKRERFNPSSYTSMLRSEKSEPGACFWNKLRTNRLPDDSEAVLHFENVGDLDHDYYEIAWNVIKAKLARLATYRSKFEKNVLLVHDELSEFKFNFERRIPVLRSVLNSIPLQLRFDAVILVDGNHHSQVKAFKL